MRLDLLISYSHKNDQFAEDLKTRLEKSGARVWKDDRNLMAGDVDSQIKAAIAEKDAVIFVLSKDSVESDYVEMELGWAREVEKAEKRQLICPVQLDDTWQERANSSASWGQISRKVVLDFSDWQEGDFPDSEYAKLVQGLLSNYSSRNAD